MFYVFDFQMRAGERRLSVCHSGFFGGEGGQEGWSLVWAEIEMMHCSPSLQLQPQ